MEAESTETKPLLDKEEVCIEGETTSKSELHGYVLLLMSSLFFCGSSLCGRASMGYFGLPPATQLLMRGLFQFASATVILFGFMDYRAVFASMTKRVAIALVVRSVVGALIMKLGYIALSLAPLGMVKSIFYLSKCATPWSAKKSSLTRATCRPGIHADAVGSGFGRANRTTRSKCCSAWCLWRYFGM